jgi:hypothetical protein
LGGVLPADGDSHAEIIGNPEKFCGTAPDLQENFAEVHDPIRRIFVEFKCVKKIVRLAIDSRQR